MAADPIKSKYYTGTFAGGQGPIHGLEKSSAGEESTLHGGEGKHIGKVSDGGMDSKPSGEDAHFDLHGKSYAGPENFVPTNKGVVNPDVIEHS